MNGQQFKKITLGGLVHQNPTFRLVLGMCPTLAVTTSLMNGLGMGLATTFVLLFSNMLISLLRKWIPDKVRIPCYIIIIAAFVTAVEMIMFKFLPELYESLGIFISLITVNCIILARAEAFASSNPVLDSALDGLSMGLGFTLSISILGLLREFIGAGTVLGFTVLSQSWFPVLNIFLQPAGGFLALGLLMALFNHIYQRATVKKEGK